MNMEFIRAMVRPIVTVALVLSQIGLALAWAKGADGAEQAFAGLGAFTMMVITFWFKDREDKA